MFVSASTPQRPTRWFVALSHFLTELARQVRVLVLCNPDAEAAAKLPVPTMLVLDEYIDKIKGGWTDVDVIITQPAIMGKIGALGRVLGPRGLMPNPKSGTVTMDVAKAVEEVKKGKIDFKVDKNGIVHTSLGKVSFTPPNRCATMPVSSSTRSSNSNPQPPKVHTSRASTFRAQWVPASRSTQRPLTINHFNN